MEETPEEMNTQPAEESIFKEEDFSSEGYDKRVNNARNAIFVVAVAELIFGTVLFIRSRNSVYSIRLNLSVIVLISIVFFALGWWTKKKPYTAILSALVFYIGLFLLDAVYEPSSIFTGFVIKIFIVVYLFRGLQDAREAQRWKETFGKH